MKEATYERILDARIQARLRDDRIYLNAENADEQRDRERYIEFAEERTLAWELLQRDEEVTA